MHRRIGAVVNSNTATIGSIIHILRVRRFNWPDAAAVCQIVNFAMWSAGAGSRVSGRPPPSLLTHWREGERSDEITSCVRCSTFITDIIESGDRSVSRDLLYKLRSARSSWAVLKSSEANPAIQTDCPLGFRTSRFTTKVGRHALPHTLWATLI